MSTGPVDEKVRGVLDLGDSSGVVKALNAEVDQLLDKFRKQTEAFDKGKMSAKDYTAALNHFKGEVSSLRGAMGDLGAGGGGMDFENVNRKIFALERGLTGLLSGSGLGRAGSMLESGLTLFGVPAGIGMMSALLVNTVEKIGSQVKEAWNNLFKQFSAEQVQQKLDELKQRQQQIVGQVAAMAERPVPGTEGLETELQKMLGRLFNVGTLTGPKGLRQGLIQAMLKGQGGTPANMSPEEQQELKRLWAIINPGQALIEAQKQGGWIARTMQFWDQMPTLADYIKRGGDRVKWDAQTQINALAHRVAERTAGQLLLDAQRPGRVGQHALEQLQNMASKFPELLGPGTAEKLNELIRQHKTIEQAGGGQFDQAGRDSAAFIPPTPADIQRQQQVSALGYGRVGSRSGRENRDFAAFQAQIFGELIQQFPGLKMGDPNHLKLMQAHARDLWSLQFGGPPTRSGQEALERRMAYRERIFSLLQEHPEMTQPEIGARARQDVGQMERAVYPERFYGRRQAQRPRPRHLNIKAGTPEAVKFLRQPGPIRRPPQPAAISPQMAEIGTPAYRAGVAADLRAEVDAMGRAQAQREKALFGLMDRMKHYQDLYEKGQIGAAKLQQYMSGLQFQIERLMGQQLNLNRNADNLLSGQQRSQQNSTGAY